MARVDELLGQVWEGEILGESFFVAVEGALPSQAHTWRLLARLERATGALVGPVAQAHGVAIDAESSAATGSQFGAATNDLTATIDGSLEVATQFLALYEELGTLLPSDETWLATELVTHEHALAACLEGVRDGNDGAEAVRQYLERHHG